MNNLAVNLFFKALGSNKLRIKARDKHTLALTVNVGGVHITIDTLDIRQFQVEGMTEPELTVVE